MTHAAVLNLAVCAEERSDVEHDDAAAESQVLPESLAPRAAPRRIGDRGGSRDAPGDDRS